MLAKPSFREAGQLHFYIDHPLTCLVSYSQRHKKVNKNYSEIQSDGATAKGLSQSE